MKDYKGTHWYKCDLHLHTTSSSCYKDKNDSPEMWVERALDQGLSVVAVTDHNDYRGIQPLMEEGGKQGLVVFPGVEITCDTSKIHMLILFDISKNENTVRDFLSRCDIDSERIGNSDGTSMNVFEICTIAKKRGTLVIAAHIDEYNSINSMNVANLEKLVSSKCIDAVQVVNLPIWKKYKENKDKDAMIRAIEEKYGHPVARDEVERWRKCFERVEKAGIPMLTFSDNPSSQNESSHGLWGIGSSYTWIQMDNNVDLESLRLSLLAADSRIKTIHSSLEQPRTEPDYWIRSIELKKSKLNPHKAIHFEFHPQLNCIIGGKGSGKSIVARVLAGVFNSIQSHYLKETVESQKLYYTSRDTDQSIFTEDSELEIVFHWYGVRYRMIVTDILDSDHQNYSLYYQTSDMKEEEKTEIQPGMILTLIAPQTFIENEICEIAKTQEAFLECIDSMVPQMYLLKKQRHFYNEKLVNLSMRAHILEDHMSMKDQIQWEHQWIGDLLQDKEFHVKNNNSLEQLCQMQRKALEEMELCREELTHIRYEIKEYEEKSIQCQKSITLARQQYLNDILKKDGNYKIEVVGHGDKQSFRNYMKELLKVDMSIISEDISILENIIFGKNKSFATYQKIMDQLRYSGDKSSFDNYTFSQYFTHLICELNDIDFERVSFFRPEDDLIIYHQPNGVKRFFPMTKSSIGQMAAVIFSFVLSSGNNPLIVDQPEDDMDNQIIAEEFIPKLKRAKQERQLIMITHNANIATNADPEMIISMDSNSKFMRIYMQGTMDSREMRQEICNVLEGSHEAFINRTKILL